MTCARTARRISVISGLVLAACGGSAQQLAAGERPVLEPQDGVLAVVVEGPVTAIDFCGLDYAPPCFRVGPFHTGNELRLVVLARGTYCVTRISARETSGSGSVFQPEEPSPCVRVVTGALTYPGHLSVRVNPGVMMDSHGYFSSRHDVEHLRILLERYPEVEAVALPLETASWEWN